MPGVDGLDVCRRIRSNPAIRATKILAMTAYPEEFAKHAALEAGADAYLAKPSPLKDLKAHVRGLLAGRGA